MLNSNKKMFKHIIWHVLDLIFPFVKLTECCKKNARPNSMLLLGYIVHIICYFMTVVSIIQNKEKNIFVSILYLIVYTQQLIYFTKILKMSKDQEDFLKSIKKNKREKKRIEIKTRIQERMEKLNEYLTVNVQLLWLVCSMCYWMIFIYITSERIGLIASMLIGVNIFWFTWISIQSAILSKVAK